MKSALSQLTRLESAGLIALEPAQHELEYSFRPALLQETVYGSLMQTACMPVLLPYTAWEGSMRPGTPCYPPASKRKRGD